MKRHLSSQVQKTLRRVQPIRRLVGVQYSSLFDSNIIGLTGSKDQIERVKKQFGIYAQPEPTDDGHGMKMDHTATVLIFGSDGKLSSTIATDEPDRTALDKLKRATS